MSHTLINSSEIELIDRFVLGDNKAFDIIVNKYRDKIYSNILYMTSNAELADDLCQETFLKAVLKIKAGKYVDSGKFGSWILRLSHNIVIDYFRQNNNSNESSSLSEEQIFLFSSHYVDMSKEEIMIEGQTKQLLKQLIYNLPQSQREVVLLRFYKNLSFKEIAEITGVSINTSLGRMRYALMNIRKIVEEKQLLIS
ncbi:MAG: RNA polymerase sigma factor [Bacteroidales bacterium]